jgi:hypothetical protein
MARQEPLHELTHCLRAAAPEQNENDSPSSQTEILNLMTFLCFTRRDKKAVNWLFASTDRSNTS